MKSASVGFAYLAVAVVLGAFVAHALKDRLGVYETGIWHTAQQYQVTVALALILLSIAEKSFQKKLQRQSWLLLTGSLVFSGSLYGLALSGVRMLGAVTPIGGVLMIASLVWTAVALWSTGQNA